MMVMMTANTPSEKEAKRCVVGLCCAMHPSVPSPAPGVRAECSSYHSRTLSTRQSLEENASSSNHAFATSLNDIRGQEVFHRRGNFHDVCLDCKMTCIEELNLGVRQVFSKRLGSRGNEKRIILAPDRQQRRFRLTKIFLKLRIKLHIRCVIKKQIQLNLIVSRPL